jgi:hypothetical protein
MNIAAAIEVNDLPPGKKIRARERGLMTTAKAEK